MTRHRGGRVVLAAMAVTAALALAGCSSGNDAAPADSATAGDSHSASDPGSDGASDSPSIASESSESSQSSSGSSSSSTSPTSVTLTAHEPPTTFSADPVSLRQNGAIASIGGAVSVNRWLLAGPSAYVTTDTSVARVDLATGSTTWSTPMPGASSQDDENQMFTSETGPRAPVLSADGRTVYNATYTTVEASGTTAGYVRLTVQGLDAATGRQTMLGFARAPGDSSYGTGGSSSTAVVGQVGNVVIGEITGGDADVVGAFDTSTGKVLWQHQTSAIGLAGGVLLTSTRIGETTQLVVLDPRTGRAVWRRALEDRTQTSDVISVDLLGTIGSAVAVVNAHVAQGLGDHAGLVQRIRLRDGAILARTSKLDSDQCVLGQGAGTVVCGNSFASELLGFDVSTLRQRWRLHDNGSTDAPGAPYAYRTRIYADGSAGLVVLDAATGKDVANGKISVVAVDAYGALALPSDPQQDEGATMVFHPATG